MNIGLATAILGMQISYDIALYKFTLGWHLVAARYVTFAAELGSLDSSFTKGKPTPSSVRRQRACKIKLLARDQQINGWSSSWCSYKSRDRVKYLIITLFISWSTSCMHNMQSHWHIVIGLRKVWEELVLVHRSVLKTVISKLRWQKMVWKNAVVEVR